MCLDVNLPIYEAQKLLQPECTFVHEDCKSLKQRSRWVSLLPDTDYPLLAASTMGVATNMEEYVPIRTPIIIANAKLWIISPPRK
jgi:hypothetical protein